MKQQSHKSKNWKEVRLGEICHIERGETITKKNVVKGCIPVIAGGKQPAYFHNISNRTGTTITISGSGANAGYVAIHHNPIFASDCSTIKAKSCNDIYYIYYLLKNNQDIIYEMQTGSVQPHIYPNLLIPMSVFITTDTRDQKAIAGVLGSLDDKIDLLRRQNKTLEEMAQTIYQEMFIENKSDDWKEVMRLGDFFPIVTGKKNVNYSTTDGKYPFFTCAQSTPCAPGYSFDGGAILLAGNGDFNVKRYIGKFEAYQRTYVLIPYKQKYLGFLYSLIKFHLDGITGGAQGSVIKFITKGMIEDFRFKMPEYNLDDRLSFFNELYKKVDSNMKQIQTLESLRDTLLSKLMNGEIEVGE